MISCECGETFDLYKELKRHCMAKEFEFACKYCKKVFVSHDNRMRHHRQEHIHLPRPTSTYGVSRRLTRNGHSLLSEIRHFNTRDRGGDDEEITFRMTVPGADLDVYLNDDLNECYKTFELESLWIRQQSQKKTARTITTS